MNYVIIETLEGAAKRLFLCMAICGFFLVLLSSPTFARDRSLGFNTVVPESWTPSLDQLKETLKASSKTESQVSQQAMNLMSQNLADVSDAQLFILYVKLMQTLDERGRIKLFEEQKRWLNKRAEFASASVTSKGGSLAPLEYSVEFSKITEERFVELQKRLQSLRNIQQPKK